MKISPFRLYVVAKEGKKAPSKKAIEHVFSKKTALSLFSFLFHVNTPPSKMTPTLHNNEQPSLQHEQQQEHQPPKAETTETSPSQERASGTPVEEESQRSPPAVTQNAKDKARVTTTQGPLVEVAPPLLATVPVKVPPGYVVPYKVRS